MTFLKKNYVRFQDSISEVSFSSEGGSSRRSCGVSDVLCSFFGKVFEYLGKFLQYDLDNLSTRSETKQKKKVLDPEGPFLQKWNKIFVISCIIAVAVDPIFFYIPVIRENTNCIFLDRSLEITASIMRFFTDLFYILHIVFQFRTGYMAPSSNVYGRGVLVEDTAAIAKRYLSSFFLIDVFAVLPLPQVVVLIILPKLQEMQVVNAKNVIMLIVIFQYVPRLLRIIPLHHELTKSAGNLTETAFSGAAFNLLLFMLASHVLGAMWYFLSIQREDACWKSACHVLDNCPSLYCHGNENETNAFQDLCPVDSPNATVFDFGIYLPVLVNVARSTHFLEKFFYCFWWGLQNLCSLGQNLRTSTYSWENLFAVFVSLSGLVLFALLIGNMQTYLQSSSLREEEMRVKRWDTEEWMNHRLLPEDIKERIRRHERYRWQETRGVDEESLLNNLPKDLRRSIKRHLSLSLLKRVPMFEKMDDQLLDAMCDSLKPVLYTKGSFIVRELDPVNAMLFIMRGNLESMTTNGGRTGFFNSNVLEAGDFCGEELLTWALDPNSSSNLPCSTRTVKTLTEVEGFTLLANDLKFVAGQFRRLHSKQLQHTFRFYSQHWRTWAACFIQAAWRRYCGKKHEQSLREKELRLQTAMVSDGATSMSFGAAIYASRFARNMMRILRRNATRRALQQERLPVMLLQKPSEPDFSIEQ